MVGILDSTTILGVFSGRQRLPEEVEVSRLILKNKTYYGHDWDGADSNIITPQCWWLFNLSPQSFPGLSPGYPMASVNSPPDGGFSPQTHHQHPAAEPDGVYNTPGFNHLAEPGHSQGGGGDGYHQQQQDGSFPQVVPGLKPKYVTIPPSQDASHNNKGGFSPHPFPEYTYWGREDRQYYR